MLQQGSRKKKAVHHCRNLAKPSDMEKAELMRGNDAKLKITQMSLSNDIIRDQIKGMSEDNRK
jgi:hypothetical protein